MLCLEMGPGGVSDAGESRDPRNTHPCGVGTHWEGARPAGSWSLPCSNYQLNSYIETIKNASVPPRKELQEKWKIHHFEFPY